jgi:pentatricopeptide repeat protein
LQDAHNVFQSLIEPDVLSWNTLILGYCEHGLAASALGAFERMQQDCTQPDQILLSNVLRACCELGAIQKGRVLHSQMTEIEISPDVTIRSSILHFYVNCGCIEDAYKVFLGLESRDLVAWGTMMSGHALHGISEMANLCLEEMKQTNCKPNDVLFMGILTACTHSGLLEDGCKYFTHMREHYGILPGVKHYCSILDLFGRAGHLDLASDLIQTIPIAPDDFGWTSLLTGCKSYGKLDV